jgi:hypothetical protein
MNAEALSRRWFLCALAYFVFGIGLGVYMGGTGSHSLSSVHTHVSLVGWVSMGLTGVLYRSFPAAAESALAIWHFWLYQLAAPAMLLAVAALHSGYDKAGPVAGATSVIVLVSVLLFWRAIFSVRNSKAT